MKPPPVHNRMTVTKGQTAGNDNETKSSNHNHNHNNKNKCREWWEAGSRKECWTNLSLTVENCDQDSQETQWTFLRISPQKQRPSQLKRTNPQRLLHGAWTERTVPSRRKMPDIILATPFLYRRLWMCRGPRPSPGLILTGPWETAGRRGPKKCLWQKLLDEWGRLHA